MVRSYLLKPLFRIADYRLRDAKTRRDFFLGIPLLKEDSNLGPKLSSRFFRTRGCISGNFRPERPGCAHVVWWRRWCGRVKLTWFENFLSNTLIFVFILNRLLLSAAGEKLILTLKSIRILLPRDYSTYTMI